MKEKYLDFTTGFITKYKKYTKDEIEEIRYGLEGLYLTFTKLVIILTISIILHITKDLIILLVLFNILRFTGFGFHARTSLECLFCSIILFIGLPYVILTFHISKYILFILGFISFIILSIFAPADTVKRPLPNKKKRKIRKVSTMIISLIYILLAYLITDYRLSSLFIISNILEAIMVSPLIYKIFKQPYRNYLNYKG
ncbi:MAG: accessory gene regulator B family protein [Bacilli bacterium]|nr:accessory gene regulator B family protein [Bacilli bacterium]